MTRSADWLKRHLVSITRPGDACPIRVIAWKDPTLEPTDPKLLAGYAITDTLWAAKALKLFDPVAARQPTPARLFLTFVRRFNSVAPPGRPYTWPPWIHVKRVWGCLARSPAISSAKNS